MSAQEKRSVYAPGVFFNLFDADRPRDAFTGRSLQPVAGVVPGCSVAKENVPFERTT